MGDVAIFSADEESDSEDGYESDDECGAVYNSIDGKGMLFNAKYIISGRKDADTVEVNLAICDQRILPETTVQRVTIAGRRTTSEGEKESCVFTTVISIHWNTTMLCTP